MTREQLDIALFCPFRIQAQLGNRFASLRNTASPQMIAKHLQIAGSDKNVKRVPDDGVAVASEQGARREIGVLDAAVGRQIEISHRCQIEKFSVKLLGMLDLDLGFAKCLELGEQAIFLQGLRFVAGRGGPRI